MEIRTKDFLEKQIDVKTINIEIMEDSNHTIPATEQPVEQPTFEVAKETPACEKKKCNCQKCTNILVWVLLVAVVALFVLFFTSNKGGKVNPNATPAIAAEGGLKIAYVDTDTLMAKYQYALDLNEELLEFRNQQEASYKRQMTQFQNDYNKYMQDGPNMTLSQQQSKEAELKSRMEKLQGLEGELALKIQQRTLEESEKMTRAVYAFIREYNAANQQFDLILAKSFTSTPVLYGNEGMDITNEIVEGLNEEYKSVKGKK